MPVWHEQTKALQDDGSIQMVGIIQEQHPARCRLFMQWKGMDWPILVDAQNELGVWVVPITLLIDEHGTVRQPPRGMRRPNEIAEWFVAQEFDAPPIDPQLIASPQSLDDGEVVDTDTAEDWIVLGTSLVNFASDDDPIDKAIAAFESALELEPDNGIAHFRLGVALRRRWESDARSGDDFQHAADAWSAALASEPNQYIWRRRIQQYGPRLDKPYSFYDWVHAARDEITARGETPYALAVEPGGAEFAVPARRFESAEAAEAPDDRITRDDELVQVRTVTVPAVAQPGKAVCVHVILTPNEDADGHWNNEAEPLAVHLLGDANAATRHRVVDNAASATSDEVRKVEFDVFVPEDAANGTEIEVPFAAVYNVCAGDGPCLFRRLDFTATIRIAD